MASNAIINATVPSAISKRSQKKEGEACAPPPNNKEVILNLSSAYNHTSMERHLGRTHAAIMNRSSSHC